MKNGDFMDCSWKIPGTNGRIWENHGSEWAIFKATWKKMLEIEHDLIIRYGMIWGCGE